MVFPGVLVEYHWLMPVSKAENGHANSCVFVFYILTVIIRPPSQYYMWPILHSVDCLYVGHGWSVAVVTLQKPLNQSRCRLDCGLGWAKGIVY